MFEDALSKEARGHLAILGKSKLLGEAYLAGGTALALQIGHRLSVDLDFFTAKNFNQLIFIRKIRSLPVNFQLERSAEGTILGYLGKTRFSLFFYDYPLLEKPKKFLDINVATIKDIALMKLAAISHRGTKRDFIDLYFISANEKILTIKESLGFYDKKFKVLSANKLHILKSLVYFADADRDPLPKMLKEVKWPEVKKFFEREVKKLI